MKIQQTTTPVTQTAASSAAAAQSKRQDAAGEAATVADTATISQAGREALSSAQSGTSPSASYPLEYYAVPKWLADLSPTELSGKIGDKASALYVRGGNLVGKFDKELAEYGKRLDAHVHDVLQQQGIDSVPNYHQAMIVDKESSERLRQLVNDAVSGDQRMQELMGILGISIPRP